MPGQPIDVQFPVAGVHRGVGYQSESPFRCDDADNCWSCDPLEERMRGGSRAGLKRVLDPGVTGPVHLLANLRVIEGTAGSTQTQFTDEFTAPAEAFGSQWSQATWIMPPPGGELDVEDGYAYVDRFVAGVNPDDGRVLQDIAQEEGAGKNYTIRLQILEDLDSTTMTTTGAARGRYTIFSRLNNTTPNGSTDMVFARYDGTSSRLYLTSVTDGVTSDQQTFASPSLPVELTLSITDTSYVATIGTHSITRTIAAGANYGRRMGFGIDNPYAPAANFRHRVGYLKINYTGSAALPNRNVVVAAGGTDAGPAGQVDLRFEDMPGELVAPVITAGANPKHRQLVAAEMLGKLYIVGEDAEGVWVLDAAGAGALSDLSGPPTNLYTIVAWRSRLCVVSRDDQYNVAMSRVGDPTDWTYDGTEVGAAVKLNTTGIDAGRLADPINCLVAHSDDYLLLGCQSSLFVLRGDPTYQGQVDRLSSSIGIVSPTAYARGPNGETLFLSYDGLYALPPGVVANPESVSREPMPQELRDIDADQFRVVMAYDTRHRGVFIGLTPEMGSGGTYFWFDWQTRGFWPMTFNPAHEPTAMVFRTADSSNDQRLLFGCRDGRIRALDLSAITDDGIPFVSSVLIGPIQLGGGGYFDGMLTEIVGQLGIGSGDAVVEVLGGNCIEAARRATPTFRCVLRAGKNLTHRPRLRFNSCYLRVTATPPFAMENLTLVRERLGKQRL